MQTSKAPTPDKFEADLDRLKQLAQLLPCVFERYDLVSCKRPDDPDRELTSEPAEIVETIIRYYMKVLVERIKQHKRLLRRSYEHSIGQI